MFWLTLLALTAIGSALLTGILRAYATKSGLIDHPNARSSHSRPTPRGGGLAIVIMSLAGATVLWLAHMLAANTFFALAGGGLAVAAVGFVDDRHTLRPTVRFAVHVGAAVWCLAWLGGLPPLRLGAGIVQLGWVGYVLGTLAIVWVLNLFNFMDGIDGIAASEAVFVAGAGALLGCHVAAVSEVCAASAVLAAACAGFLLWNWPPAKIFMGDVGSGYVGYAIAVLALAATAADPVGAWIWLILGGVFFVDATFTLIRRTMRGERVHEAHRSHAYQWLARRWGSHSRVTASVLAINLFWLLPAAWFATRRPHLAAWILAASQLPLVVLAAAAGAGRPELVDPPRDSRPQL